MNLFTWGMTLGISLFAASEPATTANLAKDEAGKKTSPSIYDFSVKDIDGKDVKLDKYRGEVLLIVNTASKCGYTPQYTGLETLNKKYKDKGLRVLGFPANNFGSQEPGTNPEIKEFCRTKFNVTFDMFSKISVKGEDQAPLYSFLTKYSDPAIAGDVPWNFQKYLVSRDGKVIAKFGPKTTPEDEELIKQIEKALEAPKKSPPPPPVG